MIFIFLFSILPIAIFLIWWLTNNLHKKFYRMANEEGCAERYESIVRRNKYTKPRELESAYLEAVSYKREENIKLNMMQKKFIP